MHRCRAYFDLLDDVRASLSTNHNLDTSTHLVRALDGEVNRILRG